MLVLFLAPQVQEVVSEQLLLSLQLCVLFTHRCDILLQGLHVVLCMLVKMELEDFNF